jgi:hypothetical protein
MTRRPEFARNMRQSRLARCFGQGIIEPVDDIRVDQPGKERALMRALCDDSSATGMTRSA